MGAFCLYPPDGVEVGELTKEMIADIVKAYGHVAGLAKRAGFEMLMIHGGHGWLINQFFSPYFNKRTDEYGGCLENRCRFAIEVLKAVREAVGPRFPIEFRMSGSELFEGGYDLEEGCRIAQQIEPYIDCCMFPQALTSAASAILTPVCSRSTAAMSIWRLRSKST